MTTFGDQLYQYGGMPVGLGGGQIPATTGNYYFVDSGTGLSSNDGTSTDDTLATIDQAVGKCTANNGDIIIVMPGHAENMSTSTSLVVDVAGVSIIGLGQARTRPVLTWTADSAIELDAANCRISNLVFLASITAVTVGINVDNNDIEIDNCEFNMVDTGDDFAIMVDVDAFDRITIRNNYFKAETAAAGCNQAIRQDDAQDVRILNNVFAGDFTDSCISGTAGSAAASTDHLIVGNLFHNVDTTAGEIIDLHDNSTGFIAKNVAGSAYTTNITASWDSGDCHQAENYINNLKDETGGTQSAST